ncbi:uncharacterized protein LOC143000198 [Genypterus blacodes]|uniref:uncharacterized protein LOC143000198 n=1 Tax=Genypterus blacodes TaxID=154954 RepID=UPI003F769089
MYTDGTQTTGHHRFLQHNTPCHCQSCVQYEPPYPHHGEPGYRPGAGQTDHPLLDHRRDIQAPRLKDVGGTAFTADRVERGGHRSPQRRPVFAGPGSYGQPSDTSQIYPWEFNPAQRSYPPEPGVRHYPFVKEQCVCVVWSDTRAHPFNSRLPPEPLPHLQVKGRGHRHRQVRYASEGEEEEGWGCGTGQYHWEPHADGPQPGHLLVPNGHCGPGAVGGEGRDNHQEWSRLKGGSEGSCNGRGASHKSFFPTEVPQKHLNQSRRKGPCVPPPAAMSQQSSKPTTNNEHRCQDSEAVKQKRTQDSVREQIRQVVTHLEDVLGGLKQVHVEMREVVQQIDRLTANIDLNQEGTCIAHGGSNHFHSSASSGDLSVIPVTNHRSAPAQVSYHTDEDRIILRTNSPSPVHMAAVVKTSRIAASSHSKDINGHPPHLYPSRDSNHVNQTHPEPPSQSLDQKVMVGNSTSISRTQKPPPYPQNGRCGKGSYLPPKPTRTPAYPGRGGRHSTSMV